MRRWSGVLMAVALVLVAACHDEPVGPASDGQPAPSFAIATGGTTVLLPGAGYQARAITPAGWILGFSSGTGASRVMVSWEPNGSWQLDTVVGGPTRIPERLTNSLGDAIPGTAYPAPTGPILTEVWLATNGGGPYTSAPGSRLAAPTGVFGEWFAAHLNRDPVLVGSACIGPQGTCMWYPIYWPHIDGGWPEARRLPGPTWMVAAIAGAISDNGLVVGGISEGTSSGWKSHARAWMLTGTGTAMTADTLPDLPWVAGAEQSEATAVNNEGVIAGYFRVSDKDYPAAWLPTARFVYSYPSPARTLPISVGSGQNLPVNACGWIALVEYRRIKGSNRTYGVVWNAWTNTVLELPMPSGFTDASPYDIANNGNVVGTATVRTKQGSTTRAVLWQGYIPACTP